MWGQLLTLALAAAAMAAVGDYYIWQDARNRRASRERMAQLAREFDEMIARSAAPRPEEPYRLPDGREVTRDDFVAYAERVLAEDADDDPDRPADRPMSAPA